jgi:O-antigen/teichoic acid export membrane protein
MARNGVEARPSLARGGAILAVAAVLANAASYAFTIVLARSYGSAEYGALGALLGASLIGVIPAGALQYLVARRVAMARLGPDRNDLASLRFGIAIGVALAFLGLAVAPLAGAFLHLGSPWPAAWLAAMLLPYTVQGALLGSLLGHERYVAFAAGEVLVAVVRLGAGLVAAALSLSVTGAMATLAGSVVASCLAVWWLTGTRSWRHRSPGELRVLVGDFVRSCAAIAGIVVLSNVDLLLARHYLPRDVSGAYALASLFAKACLWGAQFVPMTVFPRLSREGRHTGLLLRAAAVTAAAGGVGILLAAVAGEEIVAIVAGSDPDYAAAAELALPFAVLGTLWALVQLALLAAVAAGDSRPGRLLWVLVAVEAAVIAVGPHETAAQIVAVCLIVTTLLVVGCVVLDLTGAPRRARQADRQEDLAAPLTEPPAVFPAGQP